MNDRLCGVALALALVAAGCRPATDDSQSSAAPSVYRLPTAPDGHAASIGEVVEQLADAEGSRSVTLVGKIDAGESTAFDPRSAIFLVSDLPPPGHDDPGHADNCPFCKRRAASAPKAMVRLVDAAGAVVDQPADQAAGLSPGDVVEVAGEATYDPAIATVTIDAVAVYVRP